MSPIPMSQSRVVISGNGSNNNNNRNTKHQHATPSSSKSATTTNGVSSHKKPGKFAAKEQVPPSLSSSTVKASKSEKVASTPKIPTTTTTTAQTKGALVTNEKNDTSTSGSTLAGRKRKRTSAFRIKVGCVVALRSPSSSTSSGSALRVISSENHNQNHHGNAESKKESLAAAEINHTVLDWDDPDWLQVWTTPLAGRDEGLALVGRRVRCFFPQASNTAAAKESGGNSSAGKRRTVLEGEVCAIQDENMVQGALAMPVELLIDNNLYQQFSFLPRMEEEIDISALTSETAKRHARLEESIRGKNKTIVQVLLQHPGASHDAGAAAHSRPVKWAISRRIPAKLSAKQAARKSTPKKGSNNTAPATTGTNVSTTAAGGDGTEERRSTENGSHKRSSLAPASRDASGPEKKKRKTASNTKTAAIRHVGDGNDSADQQIQNWRWMASRYHDMLLTSHHDEVDPIGSEVLSLGFIGQVLSVDSSSSNTAFGSTLATVTLQRLVLPEYTASGRQTHHGPFDLFLDYDSESRGVVFQAPVEQLVIVSRKVNRVEGGTNLISQDGLGLSDSYSLEKDCLWPLGDVDKNTMGASDLPICHRCRRCVPALRLKSCEKRDCARRQSATTTSTSISWCDSCLKQLERPTGGEHMAEKGGLPCCRDRCDCRSCQSFVGSHLLDDLALEVARVSDRERAAEAEGKHPFDALLGTIPSLNTIDFDLPHHDFLGGDTSFPTASQKPIARVKPKNPKKIKRQAGTKSSRGSKGKSNGDVETSTNDCEAEVEDYSVFKATCARELEYDPYRKKIRVLGLSSVIPDKPRNKRETEEDRTTVGEKEDKQSSSSRAARANQRRVMKDVTRYGAASLGFDALAGREPKLRFERSSIHAWGVFAEENLGKGEMVIEYRGELIGNTMAEKREREYEQAKIGSDYMFRIDSQIVCDATKHGNVARFINASCDPNCYTKIINADGTKRIAIYTKRDIRAGEELSYDYKFACEYDESKRIPCRCGARDCRGFLNWDKRYIAIETPPERKSGSAAGSMKNAD